MTYKSEYQVTGKKLIKKVKELIKEGNVRRIIIRDGKGKKFIEIPVTLGILGVAFAPYLAALGAVAALAIDYKIEVIRKEPVIDEDFSEETEDEIDLDETDETEDDDEEDENIEEDEEK